MFSHISSHRIFSRRDYLAHKEAARHIVHERLAYFRRYYADLGHDLSYHRVAVRDQRSRWGSCSKVGNLNFNYRLVRLRPELQDYIIVHELCHIKEFNHAPAFWTLVALAVPQWRQLRAELRTVKFQ
jgi:predicted metal-dependent hydrolase